ncbi:hypothetical protein [Bizionia arctica]|uniref:NlpE C-terminal OB domain-containing protein n=1 Tax=Bizionia arctica TaxID=1495645 RepID=A0A917LL65_9FLAO|nr:hypothetical protein [Bizionia arctica]GGG38673.1 hypothetical protein GCM10010976_08030 [Bizionia arctica]
MKKTFILFLAITTFYGCKNDSKTESLETDSDKLEQQNDDLTLLMGDFVYYADAAVLQTQGEVYGVVVDEKMQELNEMVKAYKVEETDMVPVEVKGKIVSKPEGEEGWPFRVEIKEILYVTKPDPNKKDIILESGK